MADTQVVPVWVFFVPCESAECPDLQSLREATGLGVYHKCLQKVYYLPTHSTLCRPVCGFSVYGLVGFFLCPSAPRVVYFMFQSWAISL